ncbi:MAG: hypothetical protein ABH811_00270 [archaeon]
MFNKKEIAIIFIVTIILAFTISLIKSGKIFVYTLFTIFLIILINVLAKKMMSYFLDSEIELKLWEIKQLGLGVLFWRFKGSHPSKQFKKPFPAGAFLPIITTAFSFGYLTWMASIVFEVKHKIYRAAKRHGIYSFSEIPEFHIGLIATAGIVANLLFALIGYLINYPTFARLNIYYAFYNIIPFSGLDGNKIFFGSKLLWGTLATIVLFVLISSLIIL